MIEIVLIILPEVRLNSMTTANLEIMEKSYEDSIDHLEKLEVFFKRKNTQEGQEQIS